MKKYIMSFLLCLMMVGCTATSEINLNQFKNVSFLNNLIKVEAEYGEEIDIEELEFILGRESLVVEPIDIITDEVGTQEVNISLNNRNVPIEVVIEDTQAPIISCEKEYTVYQGEKIDLNKKITAKDPVDGIVDIKIDKYDTSKVGKQTLTVSASDKHGNKETKDIILHVKKKPVVETQNSNTPTPTNKPSTNNKTESNTKPSTPKPSKPKETTSPYRDMALRMFNIVNNERASQGVHKLVWSDELHRGANIRSKEIVSSFSHTRPNGSYFNTVSHLAYGENLAFGYQSETSAHQGLMDSPGHKANILDTDFNTMGIGVHKEDGVFYYTQLFGY